MDGFWSTTKGKLARAYLDAWGEYMRLEETGGLALASPSGNDGGRSTADGMPGLWERAVTVDLAMDEMGIPRRGRKLYTLPRLLRFIYAEHCQESIYAYAYLMVGSGEPIIRTLEQIAAEGEPARYRQAVPLVNRDRRYDLNAFEDPNVDRYLQFLMPDLNEHGFAFFRRKHLEDLHRHFAETLPC